MSVHNYILDNDAMVITSPAYKDHRCDLCGSDDPIEISYSRLYTGNQPIHIYGICGFVYVRARHSSEEIAACGARKSAMGYIRR